MNKVELKKKNILEISTRLFALHGFHGLNTEVLAQEAGTAKGTIFRIFDSKSNLANECLLLAIKRYDELTPDILSTQPSPYEQFSAVWDMFRNMYEQFPFSFIFFELHLHQDFVDERVIKERSRIRGNLRNWFETLLKSGAFQDHSLLTIHGFLLGPLFRLIREEVDGHITLTDSDLKKIKGETWKSLGR